MQLGGDDERKRLTDSIETAYREGGGAAWVLQMARDEHPDRMHLFSERFECRVCGIAYEDPQPRLFSFNNPVRCLSHLPRLRQHRRTGHGPGGAGSVEVDRAERHRAVEQAALPHAARGAETGCQEGEAAPRRAVVGPHRGREAVRRRRERGLRRRPRLLPLAREEEIQGSRPRLPEPLSRIPDVSGLRRQPSSRGGAGRARVGPHDRQGVRAHRSRRTAVLREARAEPRRKRRSPTRFSRRFAGA